MNPKLPLRHLAFITPLLCSLAALPILLPLPVHAAEAATTVAETRTVGEFQAISAQGHIELDVRQGAAVSVQVRADAQSLPLLETVVEGSGSSATLKLRWKREASMRRKLEAKVDVVMPRLTALSSAGAGDIHVHAFDTPALQIALSGSADAWIEDLKTQDLGIRISGSSDVKARGSATRVVISIAGSGDVQLAGLRADDVKVSIAGSGDATVNAQKTLNVNIAGSGSVKYSGDAALTNRLAGSGSVSRQ